jgi:hypothetical protein
MRSTVYDRDGRPAESTASLSNPCARHGPSEKRVHRLGKSKARNRGCPLRADIETRRVSPPGPRGRPRSFQNGISSSRSTSSGFSFSADFGRLRKSTFSAMISQP